MPRLTVNVNDILVTAQYIIILIKSRHIYVVLKEIEFFFPKCITRFFDQLWIIHLANE